MNLINEIKQIPFENYLCLASFDSPNTYTAHELPDIILNTLILNNTDHKIKKVIYIYTHIYADTTLEQKYFQYNGTH